MSYKNVRNALPMPGVTETPQMGEDNLLYSTANLVKVGFTFAKSATAGPDGDGILPQGQLVGVITASKKYREYDPDLGTEGNPADDGRKVAVGVLLDEIDISEGDQLANVALGGEFLQDKLVGLDTAAKTALGGVSVNIGKFTIFRF